MCIIFCPLYIHHIYVYTHREHRYQCAPVHALGPMLVHDTTLGEGSDGIPRDLPSLRTGWSQYYRQYPRYTLLDILFLSITYTYTCMCYSYSYTITLVILVYRDPSIINEIAPWAQKRLDSYAGLIESRLQSMIEAAAVAKVEE